MLENDREIKIINANTIGGAIPRWLLGILVCLSLSIITFAVYFQVMNHGFFWDDELYVTTNKNVQRGLTQETVLWSLTAEVAANWHPLTLLSHMLDCQLYGLKPGGHHLTNLFFHIANTLLLFYVLLRMTGALWKCAFVAALFALHPLHVESVAWVAERKDVLSTFFWMLALWAYIRYAERPGRKTYIPVLVFYILGLASKPMVITLPFVMLLLDCWPLRRYQFDQASGWSITNRGSSFSRIVIEKLPLFVLSAAVSFITLTYQKTGGAMLNKIPLSGRIANSLESYMNYILKMIWPIKLAVFYPYPNVISSFNILGPIFLLFSITFLALRSIQRHPFLAVGWFWYIGTLVPVIGLVQVGAQAMADRYTYIPLIGLFIMIAWGVPELLAAVRNRTTFLTFFSLTVILFFLIPVTWVQIKYWANTISLYEHALNVTDENYAVHENMSYELQKQGKIDEALKHINMVLKICPGNSEAHYNKGVLLELQGKTDESAKHYSFAIEIDPAYGKAHIALGTLLLKQGNIEAAFMHVKEGLKICPDSEEGHVNMCFILTSQGRHDEAMAHFNEALRINPGYAHHLMGIFSLMQGKIEEAIVHFTEEIENDPQNALLHNKLGDILRDQGKFEEAIVRYSEALRLKPDWGKAKVGLGKTHLAMGNMLAVRGVFNEAVVHFQEALQINNNSAEAHTNIGYALLAQGKEDEAVKHCLEAIRLDPEKSTNAYYNLACIYSRKNNVDESVKWLKKAVDKGFNDWKTLKADKDLENLRNSSYYNELTDK